MTIDEIIDKLRLVPESRVEWSNPVDNTRFSSIHAEYAGIQLWFHLQQWVEEPPDLWISLLCPGTLIKEKKYLWRTYLIESSVYNVRNISNISDVSINDEILLSNVLAGLFL
jgi:hypothetical protein